MNKHDRDKINLEDFVWNIKLIINILIGVFTAKSHNVAVLDNVRTKDVLRWLIYRQVLRKSIT